MRHATLSVAASGAAGSAVGTATTNAAQPGKLEAIGLSYSAGAADTTIVTVLTPDAPANTLLQVAGTAGGWYYPRAQACDGTAGLLTFDGTRPFVERIAVADRLRATVADANDGDTVTVVVLVDAG